MAIEEEIPAEEPIEEIGAPELVLTDESAPEDVPLAELDVAVSDSEPKVQADKPPRTATHATRTLNP
jgi:hypothetical protein